MLAPALVSPTLEVSALAAPVLRPTVLPAINAASAPVPVVRGAAVDPAQLLAHELDRRGAGRWGSFQVDLRRGADAYGREILVIDVLDGPANPVAHIDVSVQAQYGQARVDGPLDGQVPNPDGRPKHWREHMWFGLAVMPDYKGKHLGTMLVHVAMALAKRRGVSDFWIYATESSYPFYMRQWGHLALSEERETVGRDGEVQIRLRLAL